MNGIGVKQQVDPVDASEEEKVRGRLRELNAAVAIIKQRRRAGVLRLMRLNYRVNRAARQLQEIEEEK